MLDVHSHVNPDPERGSQSSGHQGPARQRLQAAFGVPVLAESIADDSAGSRTLASALRPGRHRPWLLTALLVGLLLMVGAISALRSIPQAVDLAETRADHARLEAIGATDPASGGESGLATGADTSADVAVGGDPGGTVVVHVAGQVARPGVVTLPLGARVAEAIAAAGGAAAGTSLDGLNLARRVSDGEQVYVGTPQPGAAPPGASGTALPAPGADGGMGSGGGDSTLIDLNLASSEELQELPRIGPATAAKIIAHREANGTFTSVDQLLDVPGIGERTLEGLRDRVRV